MTHFAFKRKSLAKKGSTLLVTMALSIGANAMEQNPGSCQDEAQGKSIQCEPVCTHVDIAPTHASDVLREGKEVDVEETRTTVKRTTEIKRWVERNYDSDATLTEITPGPVVEECYVKPVKKTAKVEICQAPPCDQSKSQLTPNPIVDAKADVVPLSQDSAQGKLAKSPKVSKDCQVTAKDCQVDVGLAPIADCAPHFDCAPACRLLVSNDLVLINNPSYFKKNAFAHNFMVQGKKFGHKWSTDDHRIIKWNEVKWHDFRFRNNKIRSVDMHHADIHNFGFNGGSLRDWEFHKAHLTDGEFVGCPKDLLVLKSVSFKEARLTNVHFDYVVFDHTKTKLMRKTSFKDAILANVTFGPNVRFDHVTFEGATILPGMSCSKICPSKFIGARIKVGDETKYFTARSAAQLQQKWKKGEAIGYDQLAQYSQAQQF